MTVYNLRINHLKHPFAIDIVNNSFSFLSDEKGPFVATLKDESKIISTKEVTLEESLGFSFDASLEYGKTYIYEVNNTQLKFETAYKLEDNFITPSEEVFSPVFFKQFDLKGNIKSARLIITGLGLYRCFINKQRVGNSYLTPGYNDYDAYLRYQTYDVGDLLKSENKIEVLMGDGWYKGRFGIDKPFDKGDKVFGKDYKLNLRLIVDYIDGSHEEIITDDSFLFSNTHSVMNNIYDGEFVDFTQKINEPKPCKKIKTSYNLIPDLGSPIVIKDELKPTLYNSPKGEQILDFHQNLVGFVSFEMVIPHGVKVTLKHGEVLQNKCFYNANLRTAKAEDTYIGDGQKHLFEPLFTYHGFRYVLVTGLEKVNPDDFVAKVIYTDLEDSLKVTTSDNKINQLLKNAYWGQRGNFLDVPTDCPQRDERLGWTADTQVFVNTACYNMDSYNFYKKFLMDLRYDQTRYYNGDIPMYCPSLKHEAGNGGAVWADAGTIIPWNLYLMYGDKNFLNNSYPLMKDYVDTLIAKDLSFGNRGLIPYGFTFGDWLAQDGVCAQSLAGGTDNGFINSVYYYHSVDLLFKTASELNKTEDIEKYKTLKDKIYNAILDEYFAPSGRLALDTQTSYVLSLYYGIYRNKEVIINQLKNRLSKDMYRMKTGFTGTPLILLCLFDNGLDDDAYRILFNEECPGWLYAINLGATTIWERWNSLLPDGTISGINMNSLNHYAYGSVCEAIYSRIIGLKPLTPGFKKVEIAPHLNYRLKSADLCYESISGTYKVKYQMIDEVCHFEIEVPFGCEASFKVFNINKELTAGTYRFDVTMPFDITHPFNLDTPNLDICNNKESLKALKEILPQAYFMVTGENEEFKINNGHFLGFLAMFGTTPESMQKYEEALKKIKP